MTARFWIPVAVGLVVGIAVGENVAGWDGEGFNWGQLLGGLIGSVLGAVAATVLFRPR